MYNGKTVVYTSGTFDMFHSNHLKMIRYARGLGETLIVGVSTDELVSSYKRPPIIPFEERMAIIEALKYPDVVIPQHSLDHTELVKKLNIDVFVVGDEDYYRRLGFISASEYDLYLEGTDMGEECPFFMIRLFDESELKDGIGIFHNPDVFDVNPEDVDEFDKKFEYRQKKVLKGQLEGL